MTVRRISNQYIDNQTTNHIFALDASIVCLCGEKGQIAHLDLASDAITHTIADFDRYNGDIVNMVRHKAFVVAVNSGGEVRISMDGEPVFKSRHLFKM